MNALKLYRCKHITDVYAKNKEIFEYLNILQYVDGLYEEKSIKNVKVFIFDTFYNLASEEGGEKNEQKEEFHVSAHKFCKGKNFEEHIVTFPGEISISNVKENLSASLQNESFYSTHPYIHHLDVIPSHCNSPSEGRPPNEVKYCELFIFYDSVFEVDMIFKTLGLKIYEYPFQMEYLDTLKEKLVLCKLQSSKVQNKDMEENTDLSLCSYKNSKVRIILESLDVSCLSAFSGTLIKLPLEIGADKREIISKIREVTTSFLIYSKNIKHVDIDINGSSTFTWEKECKSVNISTFQGESNPCKELNYFCVECKHDEEVSSYVVYGSNVGNIDSICNGYDAHLYFVHRGKKGSQEMEKWEETGADVDIDTIWGINYVRIVEDLPIFLISKNYEKEKLKNYVICNDSVCSSICQAYIQFLLLLRQFNISNRDYDFSAYLPMLHTTTKGIFDSVLYSLYKEIFHGENKLKLFFNGFTWLHFNECIFIPEGLKQILHNGILDIVQFSKIKTLLFLEKKIINGIQYHLIITCKDKNHSLLKLLCEHILKYINIDFSSENVISVDSPPINNVSKGQMNIKKTANFLCDIVIRNMKYVRFENSLPILVFLIQLNEHSVDRLLRHFPCFPNEEKKLKKLDELILPLGKEYFKGELSPVGQIVREKLPPVGQIAREKLPSVGQIAREKLPPVEQIAREKLPPVGQIAREKLPPIGRNTQGELSPNGEEIPNRKDINCKNAKKRGESFIHSENIICRQLIHMMREEDIEKLKSMGLTVTVEQYNLSDNINDILDDLEKLFFSSYKYEKKIKILKKIISQLEKNITLLEDPAVLQKCRETFFLPTFKGKVIGLSDTGDIHPVHGHTLRGMVPNKGGLSLEVAPNVPPGVAEEEAVKAKNVSSSVSADVSPQSSSHADMPGDANNSTARVGDMCGDIFPKFFFRKGKEEYVEDFTRISDGYDKKYFNLIFLKKKIYSMEDFSISPQLSCLLNLHKKPSIVDVLDHFQLLIERHKQIYIQNMYNLYEDIYKCFENYMVQLKSGEMLSSSENNYDEVMEKKNTTNQYEIFKQFVQKKNIFYIKNKLWRASNVFFLKSSIPFNIFICDLPKEYALKYPNLVALSGVKLKLTHSKIVNTLNELKNKMFKKRNENSVQNGKNIRLTGLLKISYINILNMIDIATCDKFLSAANENIENVYSMQIENSIYSNKLETCDGIEKKPLRCSCFDNIYLPNNNNFLMKREDSIYSMNYLSFKGGIKNEYIVNKDVKVSVIDLLRIPKNGKEICIGKKVGKMENGVETSSKVKMEAYKESVYHGDKKSGTCLVQKKGNSILPLRGVKAGENRVSAKGTIGKRGKGDIGKEVDHMEGRKKEFMLKRQKEIIPLNKWGKKSVPSKICDPKRTSAAKRKAPLNVGEKSIINRENEISENLLFKEIKNLVHFLDDIGCFDVKFIIDRREFSEDYLPRHFLKRACMYLYVGYKRERWESAKKGEIAAKGELVEKGGYQQNQSIDKIRLNEYATSHNMTHCREYVNADTSTLHTFDSLTDLICLYLYEHFTSILDYSLVLSGNRFYEWYATSKEENGGYIKKDNNNLDNNENALSNPNGNLDVHKSADVCIGGKEKNGSLHGKGNINNRCKTGSLNTSGHNRIVYRRNCAFDKKEEELLRSMFLCNYFQGVGNNTGKSGSLHRNPKVRSLRSLQHLRSESERGTRKSGVKGKKELDDASVKRDHLKGYSPNEKEKSENKMMMSLIRSDETVFIRLYSRRRLSTSKIIEKVFLECKKFNEKFFLFSKNLTKMDFIKINDKDGKVENIASLGVSMSEHHFLLREKFYNSRSGENMGERESSALGGKGNMNEKQKANVAGEEGKVENYTCQNTPSLEIFLQCQMYNGNKSSRWIIGLLNNVSISICYEHYQLFRKHYLFHNLNIISLIDSLPMHVKCNLFESNMYNWKKMKNEKKFKEVIYDLSLLYIHFLKLAHRNAIKKLLKRDSNRILYRHKGKWVKKKVVEKYEHVGMSTETNTSKSISLKTEQNRKVVKQGIGEDKDNYVYIIDKKEGKNFSEIYEIFKSKYLNFVPKRYEKNDLFCTVVKNVFLNCHELQILPCLKKRDKIYTLYWTHMNNCINIYPFCKYLNGLTFFLLDLGLTVLLPFYEIDNIVHMHKTVNFDCKFDESVHKKEKVENGISTQNEKVIVSNEDGGSLLFSDEKEKKNIVFPVNNNSRKEKGYEHVLNLTPHYLRSKIKLHVHTYIFFIKECLDEKNVSAVVYLLDYIFSDFKKHDLGDTFFKCIKSIPLLVILNFGTSYIKGKIDSYIVPEQIVMGERKNIWGDKEDDGRIEQRSGEVNVESSCFGERSTCPSPCRSEQIEKNVVPVFTENSLKIKNNIFDSDEFCNFDLIHIIKYDESSKIYTSKNFYLFDLNNVFFINVYFYSMSILSILLEAKVVQKLTFSNLPEVLENNLYPHLFHYCHSFDVNANRERNSPSSMYYDITWDDKFNNWKSERSLSNDYRKEICSSKFESLNEKNEEKNNLLNEPTIYNDIKVLYDLKIIVYNRLFLDMIIDLYHNENETSTFFLSTLKRFRLLITYNIIRMDEENRYMYIHNVDDIKDILSFNFNDFTIEKILFSLGYKKIYNISSEANTVLGQYLINNYEDILISLHRNVKKIDWSILKANERNSLLRSFLVNMKFNSNNISYLKTLPIFYSLNDSTFTNLPDRDTTYIVLNTKHMDVFICAMSALTSYICSGRSDDPLVEGGGDHSQGYVCGCIFGGGSCTGVSPCRSGVQTVSCKSTNMYENSNSTSNSTSNSSSNSSSSSNRNSKTGTYMQNRVERVNGILRATDHNSGRRHLANEKETTILDSNMDEVKSKMKYIFLHSYNVNMKYWKHVNIECWDGYDVITRFFLSILRSTTSEQVFQAIMLFVYKVYEDIIEKRAFQVQQKDKEVSIPSDPTGPRIERDVCDVDMASGELSYGQFLMNIFNELKEVRLQFRGNLQLSKLYNANDAVFKEFINEKKLFSFTCLNNFRYEKEFLESLHFHVTPSIPELNNFLSILVNILKRKSDNNVLDVSETEGILSDICHDCSSYKAMFDETELGRKMDCMLKYANDNMGLLLKKRDESFDYLICTLVETLINTKKFANLVKNYKNVENYYVEKSKWKVEYFTERGYKKNCELVPGQSNKDGYQNGDENKTKNSQNDVGENRSTNDDPSEWSNKQQDMSLYHHEQNNNNDFESKHDDERFINNGVNTNLKLSKRKTI
ncbi:conserved Plasmodium protein, unknown function [Plasmodium ovale wallikeri]|uniref:Uncharacterized protein n=2 Tax=Plasmodium ovale TaxID=36330 RepID=A0A1C3KTU7_PLAOA|nr:conserved Plasmodium protein, unknown function [Plasmodium ovale wallikeri]SBT77559.1 conserved Plasmodium protein, unknown function [Plasmodium ovale]